MSKKAILKMVDENYTTAENGLIIRVVCYIRVSTIEQKLHGLSLDAQRDTLKRYAEAHGLKIVGWYEDEGISGRKLIKQRPALQRMINDAKSGKFDRIIFIKLDRYFRSVAEYYECQKILEENNVLWSATEEKFDQTTASGRFWITQKLAMAEYEADNTGERISLVNEYKIRTGQAVTGAQSQGLAYTVEKDKEGIKRVVPDPQTKDAVMDYINHFLVYQNKKQAMLEINKMHGTSYSYNSLTKVLSDTKIYGHYKGNDFYCEPYIDKDTFDEIQNILSKNIKQTKNKRAYLFSGLMTCPVCGNKLSATFSTRRITKRPNGKVYVYNNELYGYRCNKKVRDAQCSFHKNISEHKLEKYLLDTLEQYMAAYIEEDNIQDATQVIDTAMEQIKQIKLEMAKLNNMFRKSRISEEDYDKDYDELNERLWELESHLEPVKERDLTPYKELLTTDWRSLYEALTKENKRAFWRKYVKEIAIDETGRTFKPIFF